MNLLEIFDPRGFDVAQKAKKPKVQVNMKKQPNLLKKNLGLIQKIHPPLALQLTMTDPSELTFCETHCGELNLKRTYLDKIYYYHSNVNALQEAQDWFKKLDLHSATVIFIYGIGLGYYYQAALSWLKEHPHHTLVFLEEDLNVIYRLCETEWGTRILKDPQVKLVHFEDLITNKALFNELSWIYFESPFIITSLKLYESVSPQKYLELHHQISFDINQKKAFVKEYLQYGIAFYHNFYRNLLKLPHSFWGNGLFNCFAQVPAIICGAGPSLDKNIDQLDALKDRALLFAGSSALNALIPKKIIPHFGVAIDPNIDQYSRVANTQHYSIPFFYRNRLYHEALTSIKGPRLYLTGAGGYDTARWFEEQLNIEGEDLDEGHNVVNFSLQIAHALGCNPIILVGVDLAFKPDQFYANGITANLNLKTEDLIKEDTRDLDAVQKNDIYGQPVSTLWKWIKEAKWISEFAEDHPETMIINSTEGGIGFDDIVNLPLQEASKQYLKHSQDKIKHIDQEIAKHSLMHIQPERMLDLFSKMNSSLDRCIVLLSRLIEEIDCLAESISEGNSFPNDLQSPKITLLESDLEEEISYQYILDMFNKVHLHIHHRDYQDCQIIPGKPFKKKHALNHLELKKQHLIYLRDAAKCNRELIKYAELSN